MPRSKHQPSPPRPASARAQPPLCGGPAGRRLCSRPRHNTAPVGLRNFFLPRLPTKHFEKQCLRTLKKKKKGAEKKKAERYCTWFEILQYLRVGGGGNILIRKHLLNTCINLWLIKKFF